LNVFLTFLFFSVFVLVAAHRIVWYEKEARRGASGRAKAIDGAVTLLKGAMRVLGCAMGVAVDGVVALMLQKVETEVGGEIAKTLAAFVRDSIDHPVRLRLNTHATSLLSSSHLRVISDHESYLLM
jgi:hypothetical protein